MPLLVYLVAFYAYPLYRNLDLSLHKYTVLVRAGRGAVQRAGQLPDVIDDPTFWPAR